MSARTVTFDDGMIFHCLLSFFSLTLPLMLCVDRQRKTATSLIKVCFLKSINFFVNNSACRGGDNASLKQQAVGKYPSTCHTVEGVVRK